MNAFTLVDDIKTPKIMNTDSIPTTGSSTPKKKEKAVEPVSTPSSGGIDLSYFFSGDASLNISSEPLPEEPKKKRRSSIKKSEINTEGNVNNKNTELPMLASNVPYETKYDETTMALKIAVQQLDVGLADLQNDLNIVRASKTLKGKWEYIPSLAGTMGQYLNTKVSALREINNTITKCNDFELKRAKELKLDQSQKDDNKAIMDTYNAFISMPVGTGMTTPLPSMLDITYSNSPNIGSVNTAVGNEDAGYQNYLNNLNPAQRLAMYEKNPDVTQVVVYDQSTGARRFEVMNLRTGEVIQGVDKHDPMFLEDVTLDLNNKVASNLNLNETYPIVIVGDPVANCY